MSDKISFVKRAIYQERNDRLGATEHSLAKPAADPTPPLLPEFKQPIKESCFADKLKQDDALAREDYLSSRNQSIFTDALESLTRGQEFCVSGLVVTEKTREEEQREIQKLQDLQMEARVKKVVDAAEQEEMDAVADPTPTSPPKRLKFSITVSREPMNGVKPKLLLEEYSSSSSDNEE